MPYALHRLGGHRGAKRLQLLLARVRGLRGELDLDQFVMTESAVKFCDDGVGDAVLSQPDDRLEGVSP